MDNKIISRRLYQNISVFENLIAGVDHIQAKWKPAPEKWSVLEVINHLYDEERDDFRMRLDLILHHADKDWPPIDPQNWVTDRSYNQRDLDESFKNFTEERAKSVDWLNHLQQPDWAKSYTHPKIGEMRAGDMLAAWLSHDYRHMRQLVNLHLEYHDQAVRPYTTKYAAP
jgi:hypothetical protein